MKQTLQLSNKTKAELTAMARRKKIPVTPGMVKDELIKTIKKGLRKIESQKKSKTAKQTPKKKSAKKTKVKTTRKPKITSRKTTAGKDKQTPAKKKATPKKSPLKKKVEKAAAKKSASRKPETVRSPKTETPSDLPERYGDHRLVVMPRDPNWAYAYWDLNPTQVRNLLKSARQTATKARWILRVYSAALQPGEEKGHFFDVDIHVQGGNYYLNLSKPGARFIVEIGVMESSGMFRSTAQSNPVILPVDHPSDTIAQESTFSEDTTSTRVSSFTQPPSPRSQ